MSTNDTPTTPAPDRIISLYLHPDGLYRLFPPADFTPSPAPCAAQWVDASKQLPPEDMYVLIHLTKDNWHDRTDPKGVYFKVAKLKRGISMIDREKMKSGELPDPESESWIAPGDVLRRVIYKRSETFRGEDEYANNLRPYQWVTFGPGTYFGQEVDYWMRIPDIGVTQ